MVSQGARDEGGGEGRVEGEAGPQGLGWMLRTQEASTSVALVSFGVPGIGKP